MREVCREDRREAAVVVVGVVDVTEATIPLPQDVVLGTGIKLSLYKQICDECYDDNLSGQNILKTTLPNVY